MIDKISKFLNSVYIEGWFHHPEDILEDVRLDDPNIVSFVKSVCTPYPGVEAAFGPNKGFEMQLLRSTREFDWQLKLELISRQGRHIAVSLQELAIDRYSSYEAARLGREFHKHIHSMDRPRILDIGGRSRSRVDRSKQFPAATVVVLDILPGDNVDVVGDAHELSQYFEAESFDAVFSVSVFEHLMMPWKTALEVNKILKIGGEGFVYTHQTIGMHDLPWDFWRYSDSTWDSLFNRKTGFEILYRGLDNLQYIIPFVYTPHYAHAEKSAGYEGSAVWFRKIGPCDLSWPVSIGEITKTMYPEGQN
jgi:hypothetical protein